MTTTDRPRPGPRSDWVLVVLYAVSVTVLTALILAAGWPLATASDGLQPLVEWWTAVRR